MRVDDDANIVAMAKVIKEDETNQEKDEDGQIKFEDSRKA